MKFMTMLCFLLVFSGVAKSQDANDSISVERKWYGNRFTLNGETVGLFQVKSQIDSRLLSNAESALELKKYKRYNYASLAVSAALIFPADNNDEVIEATVLSLIIARIIDNYGVKHLQRSIKNYNHKSGNVNFYLIPAGLGLSYRF